MSAKSKPSTGRHAELSKISETSSRALMRSNLTAVVRGGSGCHLPEQAADRTTGGVGQVVDHVRDRIQRVGRTATVPAALGRRLVRRPARGRPVSRGTVPGFEPPEGAPPPAPHDGSTAIHDSAAGGSVACRTGGRGSARGRSFVGRPLLPRGRGRGRPP